MRAFDLTGTACDVPTARERLRRIEVRTIGEPELADKVRLGAQVLFLANPQRVTDTLRGIAGDSVHRTITRQGLVSDLRRHGLMLRRLTDPAAAGAAIRTATDRFLDAARRRFIRGQLVPRSAAVSLSSRLSGEASDTVITGRAGSGKTACVVQIADALLDRGLPVLAFRLDTIRLVSASTTADIGQRLDLEESPILVLAAAAEATGQPAVLIVDHARYARELRGLFSDDAIRPHLKDLAFALLADVPNPTEEEWAIWKTWIDPALEAVATGSPNSDKLSALAWRRFFGSRPWFADVDRRGIVADWLASDHEAIAGMAVNYLWVHHRHSSERVAELLEPYASHRCGAGAV